MSYLTKTLNYIISGLDRRKLLFFVSDKQYVKTIYKLKTGKRLNISKPKSFNEKLQWLKIYDHNPRYTALVDKIEAKKTVGDLIGEKYIVPLYGIWERAEEIDYSILPNQFILKCNHDQGSVIIVDDKTKIDKDNINRFLNNHIKHNAYYGTREYAYKNIKPRIFAEKYLGHSIFDYKFYCFNGVPKFLYVGQGLTVDHSLKIDFFDMDWKKMPFYRTDYERLGEVSAPSCFEEMKEIATKLAKDTKFVRIDLFEVNNQVYFSEFTLCPASGYMPFVPEKYDDIVGSWICLSN